MSEPSPSAPPRLSISLLLASVVLLLQVLVLFNPEWVYLDCEELYNATHGTTLLDGHASRVLELQYRPFCGGCTLDAVLGALSMGLLGRSFLAWKLVPLAFTALGAAVGHRWLWRISGPIPAFFLFLLMALAPYAWIQLSLLAWGNHFECAILVLLQILLLAREPSGERGATSGRVALAGLVTGMGLWISFSMTFAAAAGFGWLALRRRPRDLVAFAGGLALGLLPWLVRLILTGEGPFGPIYRSGEVSPQLGRVPDQLLRLVAPRQLAALFGLPRLGLGIAMGVGWLASWIVASLVALRRGPRLARMALVWMGAWLLLYGVSGFQLKTFAWPEISSPSTLRYAAPLYPLAFLVLALVAADGWTAGRRKLALLLLAPPLLAGVVTRAASFGPPFPDAGVLRRLGTDHDFFRHQAGYLLSPSEHAGCGDEDPLDRSFHAFSLGRLRSWDILERGGDVTALLPETAVPERSFFEGVGSAAIDLLDPDGTGQLPLLVRVAERLSALSPEARRAALQEAAWERIYRNDTWRLPLTRFDDAELRSLSTLLGAFPTEVADAFLYAYGRRWGKIAAAWSVPRTLPFPRVVGGEGTLHMAAFAEGLGEGLGEKWGVAEPPYPDPLPESMIPSFQEGYRRGVSRYWEGPPVSAEPGLPMEDEIPALRWWRSGPKQQGACQ